MQMNRYPHPLNSSLQAGWDGDIKAEYKGTDIRSVPDFLLGQGAYTCTHYLDPELVPDDFFGFLQHGFENPCL